MPGPVERDRPSGPSRFGLDPPDLGGSPQRAERVPGVGCYPWPMLTQRGRLLIRSGEGRERQPVKVRGQTAWKDAKGNIWVPDLSGHGGPHWDVEFPDGGHINVDDKGVIIGAAMVGAGGLFLFGLILVFGF